MGAAARLAELGLELPEVALPLAAYVPAVRSGSYVYTSGQLPFVAGSLPATGKVGVASTTCGPEGPRPQRKRLSDSACRVIAVIAAQVGVRAGICMMPVPALMRVVRART